MVEIVRIYRQSVPAFRFIGKKYGDADRENGMFGVKWVEWQENGWFRILERYIDRGMKNTYEDSSAYIGLMRGGHGEPFEYWIGMFVPENTTVPEEFEYVDFPKSEYGVCWIYGKEDEVYCREAQCGDKLHDEGFEIISDWCFERYSKPRFTTPDEKGNIILDIGFFISAI